MKRERTIAFVAVAIILIAASAIMIFRDGLRMAVRDVRYSPTRPIRQYGADAVRFNQQHERILKLKSQGPFDVIFLGDSLIEFWLQPEHQPSFAEHFGHLRTANFGVSSDATQNVLWRITEGKELDGLEPPKLIVLLIGTNNTPTNSARAIANGIEAIVRNLRAKLPTTKILIVSLLPRERGGDVIDAKIRDVNARIAKLDDGQFIRFADIAPNFRDANGQPDPAMLSDGLHLSVSGYERLGVSLRREVNRILRLP